MSFQIPSSRINNLEWDLHRIVFELSGQRRGQHGKQQVRQNKIKNLEIGARAQTKTQTGQSDSAVALAEWGASSGRDIFLDLQLGAESDGLISRDGGWC